MIAVGRKNRIVIPDQHTAGATDTAEATTFAALTSQRLLRRASPPLVLYQTVGLG
jgi:hypothetical protein